MKFVDEDEAGHRCRQRQAKPAEGEADFEEEAVLIVLASVEAGQTSHNEDTLQEEHDGPAGRLDLILHRQRHEWQVIIILLDLAEDVQW